jgi:hypothetical protein
MMMTGIQTSGDHTTSFSHSVDPIKCVSLRKSPYPFLASLAICSDIDQTRTSEEFFEIQRFLNTKESTSMGIGVGLEIANSFYFLDDEGEFAYFMENERDQRQIIDLIHSGYVDCLHSYGDAIHSRDEIVKALDVLDQNECQLKVWVNHFGAPSNLGTKFEYLLGHSSGDDPDSDVYHSDLTIAFGFRFFWIGAGTRIPGQSMETSNLLASYLPLLDISHPIHTSRSVLKEFRKRALGLVGDERFQLYRKNKLIETSLLRDGQKIYEFIRYCNHPRGDAYGATSRGLAEVISKKMLQQLIANGGFSIVYTHLGKNALCRQVIAMETQNALRDLEEEFRKGRIYVTTTSKLLTYCHAREFLLWSIAQSEGRTTIFLHELDDPIFGPTQPSRTQLQGLTFYVPSSQQTSIFLGNAEIRDLQLNPADESGRESVTIPLTPLESPRF